MTFLEIIGTILLCLVGYIVVGVGVSTLGWSLYGDEYLDSLNRVFETVWFHAMAFLHDNHLKVFRFLTIFLWPIVILIGVVSVVVVDLPVAFYRLLTGSR